MSAEQDREPALAQASVPAGAVFLSYASEDAAAAERIANSLRSVALALAQQMGGDRAAAAAALKLLIDRHADDQAYGIASIYALNKDSDKMFEWLDRAWSNRDAGILGLLYDPLILPYKDDPRFAAFCRKVGLPVPGEVRKQT